MLLASLIWELPLTRSLPKQSKNAFVYTYTTINIQRIHSHTAFAPAVWKETTRCVLSKWCDCMRTTATTIPSRTILASVIVDQCMRRTVCLCGFVYLQCCFNHSGADFCCLYSLLNVQQRKKQQKETNKQMNTPRIDKRFCSVMIVRAFVAHGGFFPSCHMVFFSLFN